VEGVLNSAFTKMSAYHLGNPFVNWISNNREGRHVVKIAKNLRIDCHVYG